MSDVIDKAIEEAKAYFDEYHLGNVLLAAVGGFVATLVPTLFDSHFALSWKLLASAGGAAIAAGLQALRKVVPAGVAAEALTELGNTAEAELNRVAAAKVTVARAAAAPSTPPPAPSSVPPTT